MRFVDSRCIHCGATLRVADDATHVCCQYCSAELLIDREGDRVTTKLVHEMKAEIGQKLDVIRAQNELERLDREWNLERENYMIHGKGGSRSIPSIAGSVIFGGIAVVFGIFWLGTAGTMGAPAPFLLFGLLFIGVAIFNVITGVAKATAHSSAEQGYKETRRRLLRDLASTERPGERSRNQAR